MPDIYKVVITGAPDLLQDYEFKLKSYNGIHYSGITSHLSFQLPRENLNEILARPNGEILLLKNNIELFRGVQEFYGFYSGPMSRAISLRASYFTTEITPKTVQLQVSEITNESDGIRVFSVPGNHDFNPLDLLDYNGEEIEIDLVRINIVQGNTYMSLREKFAYTIIINGVTHNSENVTHNGVAVTHQ